MSNGMISTGMNVVFMTNDSSGTDSWYATTMTRASLRLVGWDWDCYALLAGTITYIHLLDKEYHHATGIESNAKCDGWF